jgi:hypothetical protein
MSGKTAKITRRAVERNMAKQTQKIQTEFVESHSTEIFEAAIKGMAIFPLYKRIGVALRIIFSKRVKEGKK